jgi:hypothetical protein
MRPVLAVGDHPLAQDPPPKIRGSAFDPGWKGPEIMAVTEKDLEAQQLQIEQLGNELARLDAVFADALKAAGVTEDDLKMLDPDTQPPEIKKLLDEAKATAKRAGEERARTAKSQQQAAPVAPRSRRGGAIPV